MPDKEGSEKGGCCASGCGCGCCGGRWVKALITLLIGGVIGFLLGGRCAYMKAGCPISAMTSQTAGQPGQPAMPAKAPKK